MGKKSVNLKSKPVEFPNEAALTSEVVKDLIISPIIFLSGSKL